MPLQLLNWENKNAPTQEHAMQKKKKQALEATRKSQTHFSCTWVWEGFQRMRSKTHVDRLLVFCRFSVGEHGNNLNEWMSELILFLSQLDQGTRPEWQLGASKRLVQF